MIEAQVIVVAKPFAFAEEQFESIKLRLGSVEVAGMTHSQLEAMLQQEGTELLRRLLQDHLWLRGAREELEPFTEPVLGNDGRIRTQRRPTNRGLMTVFGPVRVPRLAWGTRGAPRLHPADAALNLPRESFSHGVRRRVATEAAKDSFEESLEAVRSTSGAQISKRQVEELAVRAATDFDTFYQGREVSSPAAVAATGEILVLTADGKGVVMRKQDLREGTRRAAERRQHKREHRLSKGEKRNAKRMATVAAVYTVAPFHRSPEDVVRELALVREATKVARPRPEGKRVWASLEQEPEAVLEGAFQEALRRDPEHGKTWTALSDGNPTQLKLLQKLGRRHAVSLLIVLDIIHALEYVWKAATAFHAEGSKDIEPWVRERLLALLHGKASDVAAGMRRSATLRGLTAKQRKPVDTCARYLKKYRRFMRYDQYLARGLPIATGVIEGACRHLIKDRMDLTGARWSLQGAEAVLRLRSLRSSGDFDEYWIFHERRELERNHLSRYAGGVLPQAARPPVRDANGRRHLQLVR